MEAVDLRETLANLFGGAILRTSQKRESAPNALEMEVLKGRAMKFAREQRELLKHYETDPEQVEADIKARVAFSSVENEMTREQHESLLQFVMDESGVEARLPRSRHR